MFDIFFGLLGGLALFVFGIKSMSDGLQSLAGKKTHKVMGALTSIPIVGVMFGGLAAIATQSSTLVTVMTVGFVNTGILNLKQAISVIMGANIGTTFTAQLVAFRITDLWIYFAAFGFTAYMFAKNKTAKNTGFVMFAFGIMLLGMALMSQAMVPLRHEPAFHQLMLYFSDNRVLAMLVGALFTALVQSSTAATGVIVAMAMQDLIPFSAALPLILGTNVGTTVTAVLASLGGTVSARRAAMAHVLFNVFGVLVFLLFLPQYEVLILAMSPAYDIPRQVANAHTMFSVITVMLFLPFVNQFAKLLTKLIPGDEKSTATFLDQNAISAPAVAIDLAQKELLRMAELAGENLKWAMEGFLNRDIKKLDAVIHQEKVVDELEKEIMRYLAQISETGVGAHMSVRHAGLLHAANDIERVSDHADNFAYLSKRTIEENITFTPEAIAEIKDMYALVEEIYETAIKSVRENDANLVPAIKSLEKQIDEKEVQLRDSHTKRLREGRCSPDSGMYFLDIVINFERIGDHSNNLSHVPQGKL